MFEIIGVQPEISHAKELVENFLRMVLGEQYSNLINYSIDRVDRIGFDENEYEEYIDVTIETIEISRNTNQGPNKAVIYELYNFDNVYLISGSLNNIVSREYIIGEKRKRTIKREALEVKFCFCFENGCFDSSKIHYDRSDLAWNVYENTYREVLTKHELDEEVGIITYRGTQIEVSGDCCFNFNVKKFKYFEDVIMNGEINDATRIIIEAGGKTEQDYRMYVLKLLKICKMFHHSTLNIALMPRTGGLNNVKQNIANDRFDSFLWMLSLGLSGQDAVIFGANNAVITNKLLLKDFLEAFDRDIINYCLLFYPLKFESDIEYKKYIAKLIEYGKKAIITPIEVHGYLYAAYNFWKCRKYQDCLLEDFIKLGTYEGDFCDPTFNKIINP